MAKLVKSKDLNLAVSKVRNIEKRARQIAEKKLLKEKENLITDFKNHPVSREISSGADSSNISGTLGGYGNLFSFIGFSSGSTPVSDWINLIRNKVKIIKSDKSYSSNRIIYNFKVNQITDSDLSSARMPWESGRSWITAIERGISGFSFYISKALGRSGGGIQSNNQVRSGKFSNVPYWSSMWKKFVKNLNS